ncbi:hypothetical protein [Paracoccus sp. SY]|uniref:hypothetical protein n=1 Tax=Paracoccus sp. SY TaxID=1330255 RepID=UPI0013048D53|nr:hypothetical protein [Paracoccus sp. SY]
MITGMLSKTSARLIPAPHHPPDRRIRIGQSPGMGKKPANKDVATDDLASGD